MKTILITIFYLFAIAAIFCTGVLLFDAMSSLYANNPYLNSIKVEPGPGPLFAAVFLFAGALILNVKTFLTVKF